MTKTDERAPGQEQCEACREEHHEREMTCAGHADDRLYLCESCAEEFTEDTAIDLSETMDCDEWDELKNWIKAEHALTAATVKEPKPAKMVVGSTGGEKAQEPNQPQMVVKPGPRFVLLVGAINEVYPDLPEQTFDGAIVCWDRQEKRPVFTVHPGYAQALCLEMKNESGPDGLCKWFNELEDESLASEGLPPDKQPWTEHE